MNKLKKIKKNYNYSKENWEYIMNEDTMYLGNWRCCDIFISYDKISGKSYFYTSINNTFHKIENKEVISILIDTCIEDLTKLALIMASPDYDNVKHIGVYNEKEYFLVTKEGCLYAFVSFDGSLFSVIKDSKENETLCSYFAKDQWKTEYLLKEDL